MRGVSKPLPPANVSPDGQEPCSLEDAEREYLAGLDAADNKSLRARTAFNQLDKQKLRAVMYVGQRSICIYCERQIREEYPPPRIDHWRPLIECEYALAWNNLYLSCISEESCDAAKQDRALRWADVDAHLPWPTEFQYEEYVGFTSFGEIYVRNDVALNDATRRALELAINDCEDNGRRRLAILNLNHFALVEARRAALDSERTRLGRIPRNGTVSTEERVQRAEELLAKVSFPPFVSIRVAWLRKQLGRGK